MEEDSKKEVFVGTVIWFRLVMGFIQWEKDGVQQKDMFCHFSDLIDIPGYKTLYKGQRVSFEIGTNHKNQPKAISVKVLENAK